MARWNKTGRWKRSCIARLRGRDGGDCWLCNRPIANSPGKPGRRASIEHLLARALGGGDELDNLVLCHASCNAHLGERPVERKLQMREKWHRAWARACERIKAPGLTQSRIRSDA